MSITQFCQKVKYILWSLLNCGSWLWNGFQTTPVGLAWSHMCLFHMCWTSWELTGESILLLHTYSIVIQSQKQICISHSCTKALESALAVAPFSNFVSVHSLEICCYPEKMSVGKMSKKSPVAALSELRKTQRLLSLLSNTHMKVFVSSQRYIHAQTLRVRNMLKVDQETRVFRMVQNYI